MLDFGINLPLFDKFLEAILLQDFFEAGGAASGRTFEPALFLVNGQFGTAGERYSCSAAALDGTDIGTTVGVLCTT